MIPATHPPLLAIDETMWTAKDVAAFLKCSISWVYGKAESGELPNVRIAGLLRFDPDAVRKFARGETINTGRVIALPVKKG